MTLKIGKYYRILKNVSGHDLGIPTVLYIIGEYCFEGDPELEVWAADMVYRNWFYGKQLMDKQNTASFEEIPEEEYTMYRIAATGGKDEI